MSGSQMHGYALIVGFLAAPGVVEPLIMYCRARESAFHQACRCKLLEEFAETSVLGGTLDMLQTRPW